ncbi:dipeptidase [Lentzea flaviverrucosa]|uniref:Membrane dipeptidase n=1 Tax=Lentzea flaviverrucosa TaxID=200379 RepID=A0A1H9WND7_9PSEU|nr:dipeptidase [Lentzea flaviverrucosa]RDI22916.1 membrane dipeptidase [Lentzea flaviverrucosa]SES34933.1 membrane dipeptidase [Lentzea flaviverrucosa]
MPSSSGVERARALLRRVPLVDGHNDLPWALREFGDGTGEDVYTTAAKIDLTERHPSLHTDLVKMREGGLGMQFWSVWIPGRLAGDGAVTAVLEQIELVHELAGRYSDHLGIATTAAEAEEVFRSGRVASLLGAEGGHSINSSLGVLRALRRLGVRYMTLTHNDNTPWADSATDQPEHGGLTEFGRDVVREMNRIGMLVDLSHVAPSTMHAALDTSVKPVIFSHSSCRQVADHPRNVPDDVLVKLKANGGVAMITFVPSFVSPRFAEWDAALRDAMTAAGANHADMGERKTFGEEWMVDHPAPTATLDDVVAHVEHAREVVGIDHIGVGGDYDGVQALPQGLEDVSTYPNLFGALLDKGWSEDDCAKLAGANVLRVLRDAD